MKLKCILLNLLMVFLSIYVVSAQEINPNTESKTLNKVILFKLKDWVTDQQKEDIHKIFNDLVEEVDGFISFKAIEILSDRFTTMYLLQFNSERAEAAYKTHRKHQLLATKGPELIADIMEYFYWD